jgi:hypothetical protein
VETLATVIAHKAVSGYGPIPYHVIKELGSPSSPINNDDLVDEVLPDNFLSDEMFERVREKACDLVEEMNDESEYWWRESSDEPIKP